MTLSLFCLIVAAKYEPTRNREFVIILTDSIVMHCYYGCGDDKYGGLHRKLLNIIIFKFPKILAIRAVLRKHWIALFGAQAVGGHSTGVVCVRINAVIKMYRE